MRNRIDNWPKAFNALLAEAQAREFAWGVHDCCQFARADVRAIRGSDPAVDWNLPDYATAAGATAALENTGGVDTLPSRAGLQEIEVASAQRGDLVLTDFDTRPALGVCAGLKSAFAGKTGIVWIPTLQCRRAWAV